MKVPQMSETLSDFISESDADDEDSESDYVPDTVRRARPRPVTKRVVSTKTHSVVDVDCARVTRSHRKSDHLEAESNEVLPTIPAPKTQGIRGKVETQALENVQVSGAVLAQALNPSSQKLGRVILDDKQEPRRSPESIQDPHLPDETMKDENGLLSVVAESNAPVDKAQAQGRTTIAPVLEVNTVPRWNLRPRPNSKKEEKSVSASVPKPVHVASMDDGRAHKAAAKPKAGSKLLPRRTSKKPKCQASGPKVKSAAARSHSIAMASRTTTEVNNINVREEVSVNAVGSDVISKKVKFGLEDKRTVLNPIEIDLDDGLAIPVPITAAGITTYSSLRDEPTTKADTESTSALSGEPTQFVRSLRSRITVGYQTKNLEPKANSRRSRRR